MLETRAGVVRKHAAWLCLAELSECKAGAEQIAEAPGAIQLICRQALHLCNRTSSPAEPGRFCTAETGAVCARTLRSITASSKGVSQVGPPVMPLSSPCAGTREGPAAMACSMANRKPQTRPG